MLCWNCVAIEVFLDIFLDDNCMLHAVGVVSVTVNLWAMHIVFHLPLHKKKYLVSLWQAEHLIYAGCGTWGDL